MWRRARRVGVIAAAAILPSAAVYVYGLRLQPTASVSGWLLATTVLCLAAFGARKKMRTVPLGRASIWLHVHVVAGVVSLGLFAAHSLYRPDMGLKTPDGIFEVVLASVYLAAAGSGVVGFALTRLIPGRLTDRGAELIFERLPVYRRDLRERAQALVLQAAAEAESTALVDFYTRRLEGFFSAPQHFWFHLLQSRRPRYELRAEFETLHRYLGDRERSLSDDLARLAERKDEADHAHALQSVLKGWLTAHVVVTAALLVLTLAHVVIVYAYGAA